MAKANRAVREEDVDGESGDEVEHGRARVEDVLPKTFEEKQAERDHKVANADREKIDQIIMSADVQKGGKIRIERKGPLDREYQFLTYIAAEQWNTEETMEYLKKMFGGGDYKCQTFRANGQLYKGFNFSIDYRFKGSLDDDAIRRMAETTKSGPTMIMPPSPDNGLKAADMIKLMEMGNDKSTMMMTLMMQMMSKSQETMATILAAAMSSNNNRPASPGIDPVILEMLRAKQEKTPVQELIEMMTAIKALNEPAEEKEEGMFEKILKFAPAFIPALQAGQQPAALPAPPPGQPPAQPGMVTQMPKTMQLMLHSMIKSAEKGSDPSLYADLIIDQIGDDQQRWQFLRGILTDPSWLVKLFGDETRVAHVRPWLEELRKLLVEYDPAAPSPEPPDEPELATGSQIPPQ